jgi:hypothetical protein
LRSHRNSSLAEPKFARADVRWCDAEQLRQFNHQSERNGLPGGLAFNQSQMAGGSPQVEKPRLICFQ